MKWISYTWHVICGVATLAVTAALLLKFSAPFERIIVDVMVLLFVSLSSSDYGFALYTMQHAKLEQARYFAIMKRLGSTEYDTVEMKDELKAQEEKMNQQTIKGYINAVVVTVLYLGALCSLLVDLIG